MRFLLDTNACVAHLRSRGTSALSRRFVASVNDVGVCSIVRAELMFGALRSQDVQRNLADVRNFLSPLPSLPFNDAAADACAHVRAFLAQQGTPIGPNDAMIAAIALANRIILVTHNTREFSRIPGLQLDDWQAVS